MLYQKKNLQFEEKACYLVLNVEGKKLLLMVIEAEEEGLLACSAGPNVLRLLPPLTVSNEEMDEAVEILKNILVKNSSVVS